MDLWCHLRVSKVNIKFLNTNFKCVFTQGNYIPFSSVHSVSYSFLSNTLGVEFFPDSVEALMMMMGLWCWKLDSPCFLDPEEVEDKVVQRVLSLPSAFLPLHVQSDMSVSQLLEGEDRDGVGMAAMQARVISTKRSFQLASVSLDEVSLLSSVFDSVCS